ncbi:MAG: hypothetical protein ABI707_00215 [Ferruginibacter sp.]
MKWEVITNERSSLQEYRLIDNNACKVIIKYNPLHQSARITSGNNHRLFFLESAGSLSGKTIFRNEYGMEIGNLLHDKFHPKEGSLVIDTKKYLYQLHSDPLPELTIYENDLHKKVANCSLPTSKTATQNILSVSSQAIDNNCYLLGLCWYLFLPFAKENILQYASADF